LIATTLQQKPDRQIEWVHPWALSERPLDAEVQPGSALPLRIGVIHPAAHATHPWSERRWRFVLTRMQSVCDAIWIGDLAQMQHILSEPMRQRAYATRTLFAGYRDALPRIGELRPEVKLFPNPNKLCNSFSKFYETVQRNERDFAALIGLSKQANLL
jgi:deoxyribodipyrimidine photo-lyase